MEHLTLNLVTAGYRKETFNGREYLVVPATTIVPGVLNGNEGPLLYPSEHLAKDPYVWDHTPIVITHPIINGQPVRARDPHVLEKFGVGELYRSAYSDKLTHEAWFDVERTKKVDNRVHTAILAGTPLEVSTGVFCDKADAPEGSTFLTTNGESLPYTKITSNYRPDHLAVLPDQVGACSIKDGCGISINQAKGIIQYLDSKGQPIAPDKADSVWQKFKQWFGIAPVLNDLSYEQVRDQLRTAMSSRFTQDEPHCYIVEVYPNYFIYEHGDKLYKLDYRRSHSVVTVGTIPIEVVRAVSYEPILNTDPNATPIPTPTESGELPLTTSEDNNMALTENQRVDTVSWITLNCDCWKGANDTLSKMPLDQLERIKAGIEKDKNNTALLNSMKKGFTDPGGTFDHVWDEQSGKWVVKAKEPAPVINAAAPPTLDAWLATAPPEVRTTISALINNEKSVREDYISKLVVNVTDEAAKAVRRKMYESMTTEQLKTLVGDFAQPATPATVNVNGFQFPANFIGAAGFAPQGTQGSGQAQDNAPDENDVLVPPTLNFDESELVRGKYHKQFEQAQ